MAGGPPQEALDWDTDGDIDVISAAGGVSLIRNNLPDVWELDVYPIPEAWSTDSESADFGADGDLDWVIYQGGVTYGAIGWIENLGDFEFEAHVIQEFAVGSSSGRIAAGDIEGDGDIDIVANVDLDGDVLGWTTWYQQPDGSFEGVQTDSPLSIFPMSRLADLDGDGWLDFVMCQSNLLNVYFSRPGQTWQTTHLDSTDNEQISFWEPSLGDFEGDGDLDIVCYQRRVSNWPDIWPATVSWYENDGSGHFTEHEAFQPTENPAGNEWPVVMLDADADGDMDIAARNYLLYNQGDNLTFAAQVYTDVEFIEQLIAADIDNDGDTDILNEDVRWFVNPTFDPPQFIIRLVPRETVVPAEGGDVVFDGMIYNQFPQTVTCQVWANVTGPNGTTARVWHRRMTFPNGEWLTWPDLGLTVPGGLPVGDYRMTVRAGAQGYGAVPGDSLRFVVEGR